MFVMIMFATLFDGTATNQNFQLSDVYSLPTMRRKYRKTRFLVGWAIAYIILSVLVGTAIVNDWHRPILDLFSSTDAEWIQSWILPGSQRMLYVLNSSYCRELMLLLTLICYDQDAKTSISMAVVIAFIPTLAISLGKHLLMVLQTNGSVLPAYLVIDDDTYRLAERFSLIAAHCIMYLAWIKTLRGWFSEQDLFKMRYNILAEKYQRDVVQAASSSASSVSVTTDSNNPNKVARKEQHPSSSLIADELLSQNASNNTDHHHHHHHHQTPFSHDSVSSIHTESGMIGNGGGGGSSQYQQNTLQAAGTAIIPSSRPTSPKVRKLSADSKAAMPRLGQLPQARKSVQNLILGSLISLESRGQSVESTSTVSVYQQKIGTPTITPFDDGTECFSYVGKTILLWDLQKQMVKNTFAGHSQPVSKIKAVCMPAGFNGLASRFLTATPNTPRSNLLISASWDGAVKLWDIASAKCIATLEGKMGGITCINTYDNDTKLIAGSIQGMIKLWDLETHNNIGDVYQQSPITISAVGVWSDMSKFFATSFDGCVYVWNLATKRCEKILKKHTKRIIDAILYDSDTRLITVSEDTLVLIWDLESGLVLRTLEGHSSAVQCVAVYGDSQRAITGSTDGQLIAWDIYTDDIAQCIVSSLDDHTAAIISIRVFEGELNKMYTHSMDRKLRIWDMAANICEQTIDMPPANNEHDVSRGEPGVPLDVVVAWDPLDGLAMSNLVQFIQSQGHNPTICKSSSELSDILENTATQYHIILLDLALPGLSEEDPQLLLEHLQSTLNARLVLLTTIDVHPDQNIQSRIDVLKMAPGFMEITEKPLTELTLGKILHEVIGNIQISSSAPVSPAPSHSNAITLYGDGYKAYSTSNSMGGALGSSNAQSFGLSKLSPSSSSSSNHAVGQTRQTLTADRRATSDIATSESQLHNMQERLSYVESLFACFVPVQFFEMISPKGRDRTQLGDAVCKSVTVLFSDIRDFSTMSESMAVSELMEFLNAYLAFAMPPIQENGGFVDKFIGDSIMALFSQDGTQQCISAVNCAISMMYHLDGLQDNGFTQVNTGIGINTGRMIIGLVGVETRMEPTVLGDAVNLASRLESLCKHYDSRVIISHYTREKMGRSVELYTMRELDLVAVKGKKLACRIYEILEAERKDVQKSKRMLLKDGQWDRALHLFRDGKWNEALQLFQHCQTIYPNDKPTKIYIARCHDNLTRGLDAHQWDSTNRLATK
jgi:class 3 adenylate cyclase/WD40 repeat protein